jgi:hypothetical protein
MDPRMQIPELAPEVFLVVLPRHPVDARRCVLPQFAERLFERVDRDVVKERGEPFLLPFPRRCPHAVQAV